LNFILLITLFAMIWLSFGMIALGTRAKVKRERDEEMESLRARVRVLEGLLTEQDFQLRRDIDRLA